MHVNRDLVSMMAVEDGQISPVNQNRRSPKAIAGNFGGKPGYCVGIVLFGWSQELRLNELALHGPLRMRTLYVGATSRIVPTPTGG